MTLHELKTRTIADYRAEGALARTIYAIKYVFRILEELGLATVADLDDSAIQRFHAAHAHLARLTQHGRTATLRAILNRARDQKYIASIPNFPPLGSSYKVPKLAKISPAPADVERFLNYLRDHAGDSWKTFRLYALAWTVAYTGIYVEQVLLLSVSDVDLFRDLVFARQNPIHPRRSIRPRVPIAVPILPELKPILKAWVRRAGGKWLFPGITQKGPMNKCVYRLEIKTASRNAGIKGTNITFQTLHYYFLENIEPKVRKMEILSGTENVQPAVELGGPNDPSRIRGKTKGVLSPVQYTVVRALFEAWPGGLDMKQLNAIVGKTSWRNTLRRLCADPDWASAIGFPNRGYPAVQCLLYCILEW